VQLPGRLLLVHGWLGPGDATAVRRRPTLLTCHKQAAQQQERGSHASHAGTQLHVAGSGARATALRASAGGGG
jgi:hypothetical protein